MQPSIEQLVSLTGRTALVTGGAMGIGLGIARRLAQAGAHIVVGDVSAEQGKAAVSQICQGGGKAVFAPTDVSAAANVKATVRVAVETFGGSDILVNNAGIYPTIPVMQMQLVDFERILAVNLRGAFLFTKAVAEVMIAQGRGGRTINITSINALHASSVGLAVYDASKHGLWGFTKNTALELAPHNIQVNAIAPGGVTTPGTGSGTPTTPEMRNILTRFILASDLSSYMTGSQMVMDGGALLA